MDLLAAEITACMARTRPSAPLSPLIAPLFAATRSAKSRSQRLGAVQMKLRITVLALLGLCADAMAGPEQYAVDGVAVGTQLNFTSASYREYKCSPSDQFDGLTWCQKTRTDKARRGSYIAAYSLLHSRDGNILYINRSQEPHFLIRRKPKSIFSNTHVGLVNRHA